MFDNTPVIGLYTFSDVARLIQQADVLLICAGAGIGVDSGLPDFEVAMVSGKQIRLSNTKV